MVRKLEKPIPTVPLKDVHKQNRSIFYTNYIIKPDPNVIFID